MWFFRRDLLYPPPCLPSSCSPSYSSCRRRGGDPTFLEGGPSSLAGPASPLPFSTMSSFLSLLPSASSIYLSLLSYYIVYKDTLVLFTVTNTGLEPSPSSSFWPFPLPPFPSNSLKIFYACGVYFLKSFLGTLQFCLSSSEHTKASLFQITSLCGDKSIGQCSLKLIGSIWYSS